MRFRQGEKGIEKPLESRGQSRPAMKDTTPSLDGSGGHSVMAAGGIRFWNRFRAKKSA
jgi:hypothetical protein